MRHPDHRSRVWTRCRDLPAFTNPTGFSILLRRAVLQRARVPDYSVEVAPWCIHDLWSPVAALSYGRVMLLADELVHYRLHAGNVFLGVPPTGFRKVAPDAITLERCADWNAGVVRFLRYAASFCDDSARKTFCEYTDLHEGIGHIYRDRAQLHRACGRRFAAMAMLAQMIARGDYGPRGLRGKAFARDLFLAALWRVPASAGQSGAEV